MRVNIKTSLGEYVTFDNGKIFCRGVEQTIQNPEGATQNDKKHNDRVRSSLVSAILEQVANVSFKGSFDECLQISKELLQLQKQVTAIREASFSDVSNPGYVRKKMNIIKDAFNAKLAELKAREFTEEQKEHLAFLKLGKIAAKKTLPKPTVETPNKELASKVAKLIIKKAGFNVVKLTNKAITARAHKLGCADKDLAYVFAKVKGAQEESIRKRTEKRQVKKLVVKENKEASTVSVEDLKTAGGLIQSGISVPVKSIPETRDDLIQALKSGNVSSQDISNIRARVILTRDINLHIQTMRYLGNKCINDNEYVTLGLINEFPEWFTKEDVNSVKYPLEDVELTEATFVRFFALEEATNVPSVLNYRIQHSTDFDILSITEDYVINNTTVNLLKKYSIISRVLSVVGK
jgi:hypothetical protein